ncbi:MAG: hypothetical protein ACOH2M_19690 [Cypionkella sp.]
MIRPELRAAIFRLREVILGAVIAALGLYLILLGGYLFTPLGIAVAGFGAAWTLLAYRRLRFAQTIAAPGVIEVDEAQVSYLAPNGGGFISINDLLEIRLLTLRGRRVWRLKQLDGQALLIPIDATGADRLFDAFASLPEMNTGDLIAALAPNTHAGTTLPADAATPAMRLVWRRRGSGVTAREQP